jgi:cytochrome c oxidase assembly factor CtaG
MAAGSAIALALALASAPLYTGYAQLPSRPGGISALADQHLAAGIMWVPGSIPFAAAFIVFVYRWLGETAQDGQRAASPLVPLLISRPARSCVGAPVGGVDRRGFQRTG